ncbi:hypothetical protein AX14_008068 [Amanita brunnescens Koide BX004]|nr:hypothetical protein AX14_008068 [Amanita brunnescens Koide BX004]
MKRGWTGSVQARHWAAWGLPLDEVNVSLSSFYLFYNFRTSLSSCVYPWLHGWCWRWTNGRRRIRQPLDRLDTRCAQKMRPGKMERRMETKDEGETTRVLQLRYGLPPYAYLIRWTGTFIFLYNNPPFSIVRLKTTHRRR